MSYEYVIPVDLGLWLRIRPNQHNASVCTPAKVMAVQSLPHARWHSQRTLPLVTSSEVYCAVPSRYIQVLQVDDCTQQFRSNLHLIIVTSLAFFSITKPSHSELWKTNPIIIPSMLAALIGLVISFTTGFPNPSRTRTTTIITTATVIPLEAEPYPAQPTTNEFLYLNFDQENELDKARQVIIHNAFMDWAAVMKKAVDSLNDAQDNTYQAWFPNSVDGNKRPGREFLARVYGTLLDTDADPPAPNPYVASFVCDNEDFYAGGLVPGCDGTTTSYFDRLQGKFHVCDYGMETRTQKPKATMVKCDTLGDVVSYKMYSLTASLVHEFMHSQDAGDATPKGKCLHHLRNETCS
jgi:hypothetical protein